MTTKGTSIAGRKRNDGIDFYQTPSWCVEKLLEKESFSGNIFEPCSGAGAISMVLEEHGYRVYSSDIRIDDGVYGTKGMDFFQCNSLSDDNIITNPPYYCAEEFVKKALEVAQKKVVMLMKLSFLESTGRYNFFKNTPLKKVYVFCKRVNMYPEGQPVPKNSGTIAYAWYVWEHGYKGEPIIDWII